MKKLGTVLLLLVSVAAAPAQISLESDILARLSSSTLQGGQELLRTLVTFSSLLRSPGTQPELRTRAEQLRGQAFQAAFTGDFGRALECLHEGIAVLRGETWTPARALATALQFSLDHTVVEPGQAIALGSTLRFPAAAPSDVTPRLSITASPLKGVAKTTTVGTIRLDSAAPLTTGWTGTLTLPELPDGTYRLVVQMNGLEAGTQSMGSSTYGKTLPLLVAKGLRERVAAVAKQVDAVAKNPQAPPAAVQTAAYLPELFNRVDRGEQDMTRVDGKVDFGKEIALAEKVLRQAAEGQDALREVRGDYRRAYQSRVDDTLQPFRVFVPSSYKADKPTPLVIALHGMGGNENSMFDLYGQGDLIKQAEARGYLIACPKGRGPASMYQGSAEQDVLAVLDEMKAAYRVDASRVYLMGHSMGGYGTWSIAMRHPDLFTALASISGGGNPGLMKTIRQIPQIVVHGDRDTVVPVLQSRSMVAAGKAAGTDIKYVEVPGGGHTDVVVPAFPAVFDWFDQHKERGAADQPRASLRLRSSSKVTATMMTEPMVTCCQ